jgi:hypothetical protein
MTLYLIYLGPGFDSRHLHQLFNIMQKLFENWRGYLKEAGDPDNPDDNSPEVKDVARELEIRNIKDAIEAGGFNHRDIGHRMSMGRPLIDFSFNEQSGVWDYTATIPNGEIVKSKGEGLEDFLKRVGDPYQLKLGV